MIIYNFLFYNSVWKHQAAKSIGMELNIIFITDYATVETTAESFTYMK